MKKIAASLLALSLSLCFAGVCPAHGVHVFAFVDGDAVRVECFFSKSRKVTNGKLAVSDLETGARLFESTTDAQGVFRFRPDADFLKTGHGLHILLNAGEGHQNNCRVTAEELQALTPPERSITAASGEGAVSMIPPAMDVAKLEALVGRVMDAKLAPIKRALASREDSGPDMRDIVGGIGWIIGLLGLAAYVRYRPSEKKR